MTHDELMLVFKKYNIKSALIGKSVYHIKTKSGIVTYFAKHGHWQHKGKKYDSDTSIESFIQWLKDHRLMCS